MEPSRKNPGYSSTLSRPPRRRESIADHLAGARDRVKMGGEGWTDRLATPAFVSDLVKRKIINGPVGVKKVQGAGKAQRFLSRDYRDLLQVIRLKSLGIKHRTAWIAHLWLRGHEYPIDFFRSALLAEVKTIRKNALDDFAPTGRMGTMTFSKRYDRRIRKRPAGSIAPELVDIFEPLAAWMTRPQAVGSVIVNGSRAARTIQSVIQSDVAGGEQAIVELFDSMSNGTPLRPDTVQRLSAVIMQSPLASILERSYASPEMQTTVAQIPGHLRGLLDDGRNGENTSTLVNTIAGASEAALLRARYWYMGVRTGKIEAYYRQAIPISAPQDASLFTLLAEQATMQRKLIHQNPTFALHVYACFVHGEHVIL